MLGIHLHGVSERDYRIHMLSGPCSSQIHQVRLPFFLTIDNKPASHDVSEQFFNNWRIMGGVIIAAEHE